VWRERRPKGRLGATPRDASWLNEVIDIYLSVVQRNVPTPNDLDDLAEREVDRLAASMVARGASTGSP
jgi:hypothetical protein